MSAEANRPRPQRVAIAVLAHEAQHRIVGRAQPSVRFDLEHHLPEAVGRQRRHHAHQFGRGEIGAEADETGIERHQFLLRAGRASEQDPGEAGQAVDFDQNFAETGHRRRRARALAAPVRRGDPSAPACGAAAAVRRHRSRPRRPRRPRPVPQARPSGPLPGAADISPNWPAG